MVKISFCQAATLSVTLPSYNLTFCGAIIPGQLGPINLDALCRTNLCLTRTMSWAGMPSVMQTISPTSASIASRMALAAKGGGTYITVASAPTGNSILIISLLILYTNYYYFIFNLFLFEIFFYWARNNIGDS